MRRLALAVLTLSVVACSSGWSAAETASVSAYCASTAGFHADSCSSWIDGISRLSNCDPDQARRVIDRIIAEYNGGPTMSVAANYEAVGCSYGER